MIDKEKLKKRKKKFHEQHREKLVTAMRNYNYFNKYGITIDEVNGMIFNQDGKCAICGSQSELLFVDHNHETDRVRGLLCRKCNLGIGYFDDNVARMKQAIRYLSKTKVNDRK